jgi:ribosomal-protein-alanine N-acetyltransferase
MRFELKDGFYLGPIEEGDQAAYIQHFCDRKLTDALVLIPHPYTAQDADLWVKACRETAARQMKESQFAIRQANGFLVGGCGLFVNRGMENHRAELGFWIAEEHRHQGLVLASVRHLVKYGFSELGLQRIQAWTSVSNQASQHILEANEFLKEGLFRGYQRQNGVLIDCYPYGLLVH